MAAKYVSFEMTMKLCQSGIVCMSDVCGSEGTFRKGKCEYYLINPTVADIRNALEKLPAKSDPDCDGWNEAVRLLINEWGRSPEVIVFMLTDANLCADVAIQYMEWRRREWK